MNILFVDKEKSTIETLYPLLAKKNEAEYQIATSSKDAIAVLKTGFTPDFIFMDYDTPPGNGMDVILYTQTKPWADKVKVFHVDTVFADLRTAFLVDMCKPSASGIS